MNKKIILLVIALCGLVGTMYFVINNKEELNTEIIMDKEYISNNYDIDLYDEIIGNDIRLYIKGKYIGKDEIVNNPEISFYLNCAYAYTDADEQFTDVLEDSLILNVIDNSLSGETTLKLNRDTIDAYSCAYYIESTTGSYVLK